MAEAIDPEEIPMRERGGNGTGGDTVGTNADGGDDDLLWDEDDEEGIHSHSSIQDLFDNFDRRNRGIITLREAREGFGDKFYRLILEGKTEGTGVLEKMDEHSAKKALIKRQYGFEPDDMYGEASRELLIDTELRRGRKVDKVLGVRKILGLNYGKGKATVWSSTGSRLSEDQLKPGGSRFSNLVDRARAEFEKRSLAKYVTRSASRARSVMSTSETSAVSEDPPAPVDADKTLVADNQTEKADETLTTVAEADRADDDDDVVTDYAVEEIRSGAEDALREEIENLTEKLDEGLTERFKAEDALKGEIADLTKKMGEATKRSGADDALKEKRIADLTRELKDATERSGAEAALREREIVDLTEELKEKVGGYRAEAALEEKKAAGLRKELKEATERSKVKDLLSGKSIADLTKNLEKVKGVAERLGAKDASSGKRVADLTKELRVATERSRSESTLREKKITDLTNELKRGVVERSNAEGALTREIADLTGKLREGAVQRSGAEGVLKGRIADLTEKLRREAIGRSEAEGTLAKEIADVTKKLRTVTERSRAEGATKEKRIADLTGELDGEKVARSEAEGALREKILDLTGELEDAAKESETSGAESVLKDSKIANLTKELKEAFGTYKADAAIRDEKIAELTEELGAGSGVEGVLRERIADLKERLEEKAARSGAEEILRERVEGLKEELKGMVGRSEIPRSELREINSVLKTTVLAKDWQTVEESIEHLNVVVEQWTEKADGAEEGEAKEFYKGVANVAEVTKDYIRIRNGLKPESEVGLRIVEEQIEASDELKLERFKRWAKENMVNGSALVISVAGLIIGIVMAAKGALKVAAGGIGKFAKAVARVFKKLGPVFTAVGSVISTALSWGAKGIAWLANNLWLLAIVISFALYSEFGKWRASRK